MLNVSNLEYASFETVLFQRLSVVVCDSLLAISSFLLSTQLCSPKTASDVTKLFAALFTIPGLILVDNIHFQYNGFLFGFQLLSIYFLSKKYYVLSAATFALLLNLKHIYLYIAPVYLIHLFVFYCFDKNRKFLFLNFFKLGSIVVAIFALCFAPFVFHLPQVVSRLFPFRRGLTHAYWAPNFWALYNFADVLLGKVLRIKEKSGFTSGLVENHRHLVLPQIAPLVTVLLTAIAMFIPLLLLYLKPLVAEKKVKESNQGYETQRKVETIKFIVGTIIAAYSSFLFGWHVHEKAVLLIMVPLTAFAFVISFHAATLTVLVGSQKNEQVGSDSSKKMKPREIKNGAMKEMICFDADIVKSCHSIYILCFIPGTVSLFPLLEGLFELPIKVLLLALYAMVFLPPLGVKFELKCWNDLLVCAYLFSFIPLTIYSEVFCRIYSCQFLPLMFTSVTCAVGLMISWILFVRLVLRYFDRIGNLIQRSTDEALKQKKN